MNPHGVPTKREWLILRAGTTSWKSISQLLKVTKIDEDVLRTTANRMCKQGLLQKKYEKVPEQGQPGVLYMATATGILAKHGIDYVALGKVAKKLGLD